MKKTLFTITSVVMMTLGLVSCEIDQTTSSHISDSSLSAQISSSALSSSSQVSSSKNDEDIYLERFEYYNIPLDYISRDETYYEHNHVAAYIAVYHDLPDNYVTKPSVKGQTKIGGVHQNREGHLPKSLTYTEIDVNTFYPNSRGAHRIVYSNTFRIFYTSNHYDSFTEYIGFDNFIADYSMDAV